MKDDEIAQIAKDVQSLYRRLRHEFMGLDGPVPEISPDAVFLAMVFLKAKEPPKQSGADPVPQWLKDAVTACRGREMEPGTIAALYANGTASGRDIARWLSHMGYSSFRRGGRVLYRL